MAKLEYHGEGAGLGRVEGGGDRNDPANYVLRCSCDLALGALAAFVPNTSGQRSVGCPRCKKITILDEGGRVLLHAPVEELKKKLEIDKRLRTGGT